MLHESKKHAIIIPEAIKILHKGIFLIDLKSFMLLGGDLSWLTRLIRCTEIHHRCNSCKAKKRKQHEMEF